VWQQFIGRRSAPRENWVERGAVRRFALAIGDPNPLYLDEEAAGRSRHGRLIAPPTFPSSFDYGTLEGVPLPPSGIILAEQQLTAARPLFVGERVLCHVELTDSYEKRGRGGVLTFLVMDRSTHDEHGAHLCTLRTTVIVTEAVRRGMGL
jgi:acyl dehydratase